MRAFIDTEVTKGEVLASLAKHRKADRLVKGEYWENGRGCAIGCTIHDFRPGYENNHALYEPLFGIPCDLAHLKDNVFAFLSLEASQVWPERFMTAVPIGADLTWVTRQFVYWLLSGADSPISSWLDDPNIVAVRELCTRELAGDSPTQIEWNAAIYTAASAAGTAAKAAAKNSIWDADRNAAMVAVYATAKAANSATKAANSAAWATARAAEQAISEWGAEWTVASDAARSAARNAARDTAYEVMADKLIELIKQAPV